MMKLIVAVACLIAVANAGMYGGLGMGMMNPMMYGMGMGMMNPMMYGMGMGMMNPMMYGMGGMGMMNPMMYGGMYGGLGLMGGMGMGGMGMGGMGMYGGMGMGGAGFPLVAGAETGQSANQGAFQF